ncbi:MAG: hypothetical protein C0623_12680 [Desulfuromonas sp.]|nr:MAG: hypothetical protein C0623_12680 [Desulfuromonas sp.]
MIATSTMETTIRFSLTVSLVTLNRQAHLQRHLETDPTDKEHTTNMMVSLQQPWIVQPVMTAAEPEN